MKRRLELLRSSLEDLERSSVILLDGEPCLISSNETGYNSLIIGDGKTRASELPKVVLNRTGGCEFLGIALPDTDPGNPLGNVFYFAKEPGYYYNFGGIQVGDGEIVILVWKYESWTKITLLEQTLDSSVVLGQLRDIKDRAVFGVKIGDKEIKRNEEGVIEIPVDEELNQNSTNPIQNKAVYDALDWYEGK